MTVKITTGCPLNLTCLLRHSVAKKVWQKCTWAWVSMVFTPNERSHSRKVKRKKKLGAFRDSTTNLINSTKLGQGFFKLFSWVKINH